MFKGRKEKTPWAPIVTGVIYRLQAWGKEEWPGEA
jgi:hypothetical protein